jgi:hypothetical protein
MGGELNTPSLASGARPATSVQRRLRAAESFNFPLNFFARIYGNRELRALDWFRRDPRFGYRCGARSAGETTATRTRSARRVDYPLAQGVVPAAMPIG